jgi:hypothetical protein
MKVDLTQKFYNLEGKELEEGGRQVTLYDVLRVAVTAELPEDAQGGGTAALDVKMKNYDLYLEVTDAGKDCEEFELTPEQAVHLKGRIPKIFSILICGPVVRILDGKDPFTNRKPSAPVAVAVH